MNSGTPQPRSARDLVAAYDTLGIPHFQRGLVWNDEAVSLLLESLYWRTPCGNIILWRPADSQVHGQPLGRDACQLLIVDGQQRIRMLHEAFNESRSDQRKWCLDLSVEPSFTGLLGGEPRARLFITASDPLQTKNPRYKHNLIPLSELNTEDMSVIRSRYIDKASPAMANSRIDEALEQARERVLSMWNHQLFSLIELDEKDGYGINEVVSLYNRINSAGRRVEAEEIAYATLVLCYPDTTARLREFFQRIHGDEQTNRDRLLRREKERTFGFKLFLRTFVQVCNFHFARSSGSQGFSFDIVKSPELVRWFKGHEHEVGQLFKRTSDVLAAVERVLKEILHCDDLRMLPDTDCLIPALQLLIRYYPAALEPCYERAIAYCILRLALEPDRNQRQTLRLVQAIDGSNTFGECVRALESGAWISWTAQKTRGMKVALESANTLSDRYVLLLYWLIRRNQAKDFSYENLESEQQLGLHPGTEALVAESASPEKQHIAPSSVLGSSVFGNAGRITISRHVANNVGNLTYISHKLNHFITGLGNKWIDAGKDAESNLAAHFLSGESLKKFKSVRAKTLTPSDEGLYRRFCESRRRQIQNAFISWMEELHGNLSRSEHRVTPDRRLANPDTADDIRSCGFPPRIENGLLKLRLLVRRLSRSDEMRKGRGANLVFRVLDREGTNSRKFHLFVFQQPRRIEIENREGYAVYDALFKIMVDRGVTPPVVDSQISVLGCDSDEEQLTAGILDSFVDYLAGSTGSRSSGNSINPFS